MPDQTILSELEELEKKIGSVGEQSKLEEEFAVKANLRYEKNLQCFSEYYPDIYQEILNYTPRNDFCIHVTSTGQGNVVPAGESVFLYSDDPIAQTKKQVEEQLLAPQLTLTDYSKYDYASVDNRIHTKYMVKLGYYLRDLKNEGEPELLTTMPKHFPTGIIFGLGLGYHLPCLTERVDFDYLFILEPDFELFFASLFCIEWDEIINKYDKKGSCLFFHLGVDKETIVDDLSTVAESIGAFSLVRSFCYLHYPNDKLVEMVDKFFKDYFRFQFGFGFYNDAITGLAHSYYLLDKKVPIYDGSRKPIKDFEDVPVFIVGNGPSLDECEDFLKENSDKAIIFACGTALGSLTKMGIEADFHVLVERPFRSYQSVVDMAPSEVYKKLNLLAVNTVYPDTTDLYGWSGIALKGNEAATDFVNILLGLNLKSSILTIAYSNPLVSNTALSFARHLGFNNIYLFGVDNGKYNDEHHSKHSIYEEKQDTKFRYFPARTGDYLLKGNFGGVVSSNSVYSSSVKQLESLISHLPGASILNIGDGAYVEGTIPTKVDELLTLSRKIDKTKLIDKVKNEFHPLNFSNLSPKSLGLDKAIEIIEHIINLANSKFSTIQEANELLLRQQRYLYSFRGTYFSHLFHLLKGTLLYFHCPMIMTIYKYKSESDSLKIYSDLNQIWIEYLEEIIEHLREKGLNKCDWSFFNKYNMKKTEISE